MYNPERIVDVLVRHQVYLEGVKLGKCRDFNVVLSKFDRELRRLFTGLRFDTLDGFTRATLKDFIKKVKAVQADLYNKYAEQVYGWIQDFINSELRINKIVFGSLRKEREEQENVEIILSETEAFSELEKAVKDYERSDSLYPLGWFSSVDKGRRLYSIAMNTPISANGFLAKSFFSNFVLSASSSVENLIRKGYINGWTVKQAVSEICGTRSLNYRDGQLNRISIQNAAVLDTMIQHVSSIIQSGVASIFYKYYRWVSVLDNRTTDICRNRNGKIYEYGKGPLPPAHIRCRSIVVPTIKGYENEPLTSYTNWLKRQPDVVQDDILGGKSKAGKLREGKLKAKDLGSFESSEPLSLEQFESKIPLILKY